MSVVRQKNGKPKVESPAANPSLTRPIDAPHPACGQPKLGLPILPSAEKGSDVMLTKEELAAKLKVSVRSIENWQHEGYLPFIKVANVVMFYWPTVISHLHTHFSTVPRGVVSPVNKN